MYIRQFIIGLQMALLALCLVLVVLAEAADTVTISLGGTSVVMTIAPERKTSLQKLLARENGLRSKQAGKLTALTLEQFVQQRIETTLKSDETEAANITTAGDSSFCVVYNDSTQTTPAQKATIMAIGKGATPCP